MEPMYPDISKELAHLTVEHSQARLANAVAQQQNSAIKLPHIVAASAPQGEIHIVEGHAQAYRLQYITEIQKQLQLERDKRDAISKKYKKAAKAIDGVDTVLVVSSLGISVAGVGLLSTIIAAPLVIALEGVSLGMGLLSIIGNQIIRKLNKKSEKHSNIMILADSKINTISSHISKALSDNEISDDEFKLILDELDKFNKMKREIRLKLTAELDEETKQSLINQGREQMQSKFENMIMKRK